MSSLALLFLLVAVGFQLYCRFLSHKVKTLNLETWEFLEEYVEFCYADGTTFNFGSDTAVAGNKRAEYKQPVCR